MVVVFVLYVVFFVYADAFKKLHLHHSHIVTGVTGRRIADVYENYQSEVLSLKPDLVSILIGVNDVWMGHYSSKFNYTGFFQIYDHMVTATRAALPNVKIVIIEPFVLPGDIPSVRCNWEAFSGVMTNMQHLVFAIAQKHELSYIPLQAKFNTLAAAYPPADDWLMDGVHPSNGGRKLIANEWLRNVFSVNARS